MKRLRPIVIVACALIALTYSGLTAATFNDLLSLRFSLLSRDASGEVAIVAIDAPSLAAEGVWPWPRSLHARLIDRLFEAGASDIAFDIDFSSASSAPQHDQSFEDALRRAGGSVALPTFKQFAVSSGRSEMFVTAPLPRFAAHAWPVAVNVQSDTDGVVRQYTIGQMLPGGVAPSLASFVAGRGSIEHTRFAIDFGIRVTTIPVFSFIDVLQRAEPLAALKGRKVIIGATAVELGDRVTVPGGRIIPGVMLQALAAESLLQNRDLWLAPQWMTYALAAAFALLIGLLFHRVRLRVLATLLIGIPLICETGAFLLQAKTPTLFDTVPLLFAALTWAVVIAIEELNLRDLLRRIAEKRFHRVSLSLADGLICTDNEGRITLWNPAAQRMFGYVAEEIVGQPISTVIADLNGQPWNIIDVASQTLEQSNAAHELQGRRSDGTAFLIEATLSAWETAAGQNHSVAVRDISIRKREEERIRYLAEHDALTGLLNRRSLIQNLEARVVVALDSQSEVALLLIDLDRFKEINDTLGHAAGDQVLREAAKRITKAVGNGATVARLGGDEFAIIISGSDCRQDAAAASQAIIENFSQRHIELYGIPQNVVVSIGIALYPRDSDSAEGLIADADLAMYQTKGDGGGTVRFFEQALREDFEKRIQLAEELKLALARGEFELHYQPQINLKTKAVVGAEALIRWRHPERGMVSPGEFIARLNSLAISNDVSIWTRRTACRQARQWQLQGREIRIGVNLSPAQFRTMDLPAVTALVLAETGLPAHLLELEVTEEIVIDDDEKAQDTFLRLRALGVHLAWDDFGTGYGSLIYLKKFPLNRLKIDQSFVRDLKEGTLDYAIVEYTIRLCKVLGLSVIAEGIEQPQIIELLMRMGCDEGQGYLFSKPMPAADLLPEIDTAVARNVA